MRTLHVKIACVTMLGLCAAVASLWVNHRVKVQKMDERIGSMPTKSVCVGRFIVDVPEHAVVTYRPASLAGWDISTIQETDADFGLRVQQKADLLATHRNERGGVALEVVQEVKNDDVKGKIFLFDRRWIALMRAGKEVVSEIVAIDALVRSNGISYEFKANFRRPTQIDQLKKILHQLHAVPDAHIPEGTGFCFDRGFIRDPLTAEENEHASIFFGIREHPDLAISLSTSAGIDGGRTLLQRDADSEVQKEHSSQFHRLRVGVRSLNGIPGEEVLQRVDELNGVKVHGFMWQSRGDKIDVYLPSLSLELDTGMGKPGKPINSSLSDAEALALWDKISSSLRRRPEGAATPSGASL
ncbi:T6SS immunity protein Tli4 family protein [Rugamonas rivuli]|uniref:Tle cognate immunity protein 4 C-terminal domain-containing protein n=1 Tax=Rugamonas rivuli TaxID=2743358 RepID=A0A843SMY0_9BURK|nr:T6SS immunity protein Tli4 family protein [Rugamonas rivuli]MQA23234.1 hypothetical protein [Rugamonas rivuli]